MHNREVEYFFTKLFTTVFAFWKFTFRFALTFASAKWFHNHLGIIADFTCVNTVMHAFYHLLLSIHQFTQSFVSICMLVYVCVYSI